jgi:hypothetical protein
MLGASGPVVYGGTGGASGIFQKIDASADNIPASLSITIAKPAYNGTIPAFFFQSSYGGGASGAQTKIAEGTNDIISLTAPVSINGNLGWTAVATAATPLTSLGIVAPTSNVSAVASAGAAFSDGSTGGSTGNASNSTAALNSYFCFVNNLRNKCLINFY